MEKVVRTDEEWREKLAPNEYAVLREGGTEAPFTGEYTDTKTVGAYRCRACGAELFRSAEKFESHCGWPSFYQPTSDDAVTLIQDRSLGMVRTEARCASCDSHLGHVFEGEGYDVHDHGLMWAVTTAWRARHTGPERARAVRALAVAGIESSLVNAAIKAVVGRSRPDVNRVQLAQGGVPIRQPKTSSFPSGHTLAAFCAATVMSTRGDRSGNTLLFSGAALVGISRLHVGAHHASDVLGGAAIGVGLGLLGRRLA